MDTNSRDPLYHATTGFRDHNQHCSIRNNDVKLKEVPGYQSVLYGFLLTRAESGASWIGRLFQANLPLTMHVSK